MSQLLSEEDLKKWLGYEQRVKLEQWLSANGIVYQVAKDNKIVTTIQAVNTGLIGAKQKDAGFEFA